MKLQEYLFFVRFLQLISLFSLVSCETSTKSILANETGETNLKIGLSENINSLFPNEISNNSEIFIGTQLFESLIEKNTEGKFIPQLVSNYSLDTINKTYHFTLHKNKKFSDGSSLTTKDISSCLKTLIDDTNSNEYVKSFTQNIDGYSKYKLNSNSRELPQGIELIDDYMFSIKMKELDLNLIEVLTSHQFWISKRSSSNKILGTGPFKIENTDTDISFNLERNPYFISEKTKSIFNRINIRFIKNQNALIDEFLKGSIDVIEYKNSEEEIPALELMIKNKYGFKNYVEQKTASALYFTFHNFNDPEKIKMVLNKFNHDTFLFKEAQEDQWLTLNTTLLMDTTKQGKLIQNQQDSIIITPIPTISNNPTDRIELKKIIRKGYTLENTLNFTSFELINPKVEYIVIKKRKVETSNEDILKTLEPQRFNSKQNIAMAHVLKKHDFIIFDESIKGFEPNGNWVKEIKNLTYHLPQTH